MKGNIIAAIMMSSVAFIYCTNSKGLGGIIVKKDDSNSKIQSSNILQDRLLDSTRSTKNNANMTDEKVSCDSLLTLLAKSSSLDKKYVDEFQVQANEVADGILKIKITNKNELGIDVPLIWLDLNIKKKELNDVTIDPERPIKLKYDTIIFNSIVKNCKIVE